MPSRAQDFGCFRRTIKAILLTMPEVVPCPRIQHAGVLVHQCMQLGGTHVIGSLHRCRALILLGLEKHSEMASLTSVAMEGCSLFKNENIWFSKGSFYRSVVCWRDNTAGQKQSSRFLKSIDNNNLLLQVQPMRTDDLLILISPKRRNLLGCEDQRQLWLQ